MRRRGGGEYDLPPLMFTPEELQALVLGARIAAAFADEELGRAGASAFSKIEAALPSPLRAQLSEATLFAPRTWTGQLSSYALTIVRAALAERRRLFIHYCRKDGALTKRAVRPLGAFFWGRSWTLAA